MLGKTIVHGGGQIAGKSQTNSIEAVLNSMAAGERQIELDCVKLADGFALAHDETERSFYGIDKKFSMTSTHEFGRLRVLDALNPVTFDLISAILRIAPETKIIIDSKFPGFQFPAFLQFIKSRYYCIFNELYYQVYADEWLQICQIFGVKKIVVALWKYFDKDPCSDSAYEFARAAKDDFDVLGISVRWKSPGMNIENIHRKEIDRLSALADVYFHGQEISLCREKELQNSGVNFFSSYSLGSLPQSFDPRSYKNENKDLSHLSDLCASCHYLQYGAIEGRKF